MAVSPTNEKVTATNIEFHTFCGDRAHFARCGGHAATNAKVQKLHSNRLPPTKSNHKLILRILAVSLTPTKSCSHLHRLPPTKSNRCECRVRAADIGMTVCTSWCVAYCLGTDTPCCQLTRRCALTMQDEMFSATSRTSSLKTATKKHLGYVHNHASRW